MAGRDEFGVESAQTRLQDCVAMKMCFFHLMPYQGLPENFEKDYHSVWVDVPNSLFDPKQGHRLYNDYLDELEFAEAMGFDGICVNEHHANAYGLMPSPNIMASAMARGPPTPPSWCWATAWPSTTRPYGWLRSSPCWTSSAEGGSSPDSRWERPWTPFSGTVRYPSRCGTSTRRPTTWW